LSATQLKNIELRHSFDTNKYYSLAKQLLLKGLSTVDLLIKIGCYVKMENTVPVRKGADLN